MKKRGKVTITFLLANFGSLRSGDLNDEMKLADQTDFCFNYMMYYHIGIRFVSFEMIRYEVISIV